MPEMGSVHLGDTSAFKWSLQRERLVKNTPQRVEVRAQIQGLIAELLGGHCVNRSHDRSVVVDRLERGFL